MTGPVPQTERRLFEDVVTLLSGKNAEKLIFGQHATGCAQDYARAKQLAKDMIEHFAMDSYGKTEEEIEIAENFLRMSGASKIVRTSSYSHEGIQELMELIENLDLTDY